MPTLLLRLAGPLQSWGVESKFETRRTLGFPTKSGVVGLLAAALGYSRDEPLDDLNKLYFGVRVDKEGELLRDYHVARGKKDKDVYLTHRYYLADAIFLAGIECDDNDFLVKLENALHYPAFPLFLGRRSCVPTMPLVLGIREKSLLEALQNEPWLLPDWQQQKLRFDSNYNSNSRLRVIIDASVPNPSSILRDVPVSFSRKHRNFSLRSVEESYMDVKQKKITQEHDVWSELR